MTWIRALAPLLLAATAFCLLFAATVRADDVCLEVDNEFAVDLPMVKCRECLKHLDCTFSMDTVGSSGTCSKPETPPNHKLPATIFCKEAIATASAPLNDEHHHHKKAFGKKGFGKLRQQEDLENIPSTEHLGHGHHTGNLLTDSLGRLQEELDTPHSNVPLDEEHPVEDREQNFESSSQDGLEGGPLLRNMGEEVQTDLGDCDAKVHINDKESCKACVKAGCAPHFNESHYLCMKDTTVHNSKKVAKKSYKNFKKLCGEWFPSPSVWKKIGKHFSKVQRY